MSSKLKTIYNIGRVTILIVIITLFTVLNFFIFTPVISKILYDPPIEQIVYFHFLKNAHEFDNKLRLKYGDCKGHHEKSLENDEILYYCRIWLKNNDHYFYQGLYKKNGYRVYHYDGLYSEE